MSDTPADVSDAPDPQPPGDAPASPRESVVRESGRTLVTGFLMGMANLVPGVSGGTMVLIMGQYQRFIDNVASACRFQFTASSIRFLAVLIVGAVVAVGVLSGVMAFLVSEHRAIMYALFIGMTLAGTPVIWRMMRPVRWPQGLAFVVGFGLMLTIWLTDDTDKEAATQAREAEGFKPEISFVTDLGVGALAMSAMILPGISGAYMMLLLGRYEDVTGSIALAVDVLRGAAPASDAMLVAQIIGPCAIGAVASLVLLSNALKWLLARHEAATGGFLMGILWGSAIAIWPFGVSSASLEVIVGLGALVGGFALVLTLTLLVPKPKDEPAPQAASA